MSDEDTLAAKCWRFRPVKREVITQYVDKDEAATVVISAGKVTYLNIVLHKK
jgi:hypothetical protein